MSNPKIFRKRYIPDEIVDISGDEIIFCDENLIVTMWKTIKPRTDFSWGKSYTFLKEGYKISKFYSKDNEFLYWYIDIIESEYIEEENKYIITDLLIDVKITCTGKIMLLDIEELSESIESELLSKNQVAKALHNLSKVYELINNDNFPPEICNKY